MSTGMRLDISAVLNEAAEAIEREGWGQGEYRNPRTGCLCALGAIRVATGVDQDQERIRDYFKAVDALVKHVGDVVVWNDETDRTQAEVVAKLREAAKGCEGSL